MVLVVAFGWWGTWNVGSSTLASQSDSLMAKGLPIYVAGCPVVDTLQESSVKGDAGEVKVCTEEGSSHPITSRQPGARLGQHAHGADR